MAVEVQGVISTPLPPTTLGWLPPGGADDSPPCRGRIGGHAPIHPLRAVGTTARRPRGRGLPETVGPAPYELSRYRATGHQGRCPAGVRGPCPPDEPAVAPRDHPGERAGRGPLPRRGCRARRALAP